MCHGRTSFQLLIIWCGMIRKSTQVKQKNYRTYDHMVHIRTPKLDIAHFFWQIHGPFLYFSHFYTAAHIFRCFFFPLFFSDVCWLPAVTFPSRSWCFETKQLAISSIIGTLVPDDVCCLAPSHARSSKRTLMDGTKIPFPKNYAPLLEINHLTDLFMLMVPKYG